ncbi:MAG: DNA-processing protein DprA [Bacteroidota bacterium]
MIERILTDDAKAILLLCGHFGKSEAEIKPLQTNEYNIVAEWLVERELRPGDLLAAKGLDELQNGMLTIDIRRVMRLLERGMAMSLDTEKWQSRNIWIVCRSDVEYPKRLRAHLKAQAPPFLYCTGNPASLAGGGLAIVGSRNVEAVGELFTQRVARHCAQYGMTVVSGGARGVDQTAMLAGLQAGGNVIGVVADSLSRAALIPDYRDHLLEGRLLLCSPYRPDAGFSAGMAMGRNKLVYAMADYALIVQSEKDKGGTWAGAKEELRRTKPRPVLVRFEEPIPDGNRALVEIGAKPFPLDFFENTPFTALIDTASRSVSEIIPVPHLHETLKSASIKTTSAAVAEPSGRKNDVILIETIDDDQPKPSVIDPQNSEQHAAFLPSSVFEAVSPIVLANLDIERDAGDLAQILNVRRTQVEDWLKELVKSGQVKKLTGPVRYKRIV